MTDNIKPKVRPAIDDKNKFITDASQHAMHALILANKNTLYDAKGIAKDARKFAIELWRVMRQPV